MTRSAAESSAPAGSRLTPDPWPVIDYGLKQT